MNKPPSLTQARYAKGVRKEGGGKVLEKLRQDGRRVLSRQHPQGHTAYSRCWQDNGQLLLTGFIPPLQGLYASTLRPQSSVFTPVCHSCPPFIVPVSFHGECSPRPFPQQLVCVRRATCRWYVTHLLHAGRFAKAGSIRSPGPISSG